MTDVEMAERYREDSHRGPGMLFTALVCTVLMLAIVAGLAFWIGWVVGA